MARISDVCHASWAEHRSGKPQKEALEEQLAEERKAAKAKDARHKLTVERLRRQIIELQVCTTSLVLVRMVH
jgi:hypothetical protein